MDKDSKGQRKVEDWRKAASCSGRTQPRIEKKRIVAQKRSSERHSSKRLEKDTLQKDIL